MAYRIKKLQRGSLKLWRKKKVGDLKWAKKRPSVAWYPMPLITEKDLPKEISADKYNWWHNNSIIDGERIGPKITLKRNEQ